MARCPSCSQNAHDETVLARVKGASWRAQGGWVRKLRAVKGSLGHPSQEWYREFGRPSLDTRSERPTSPPSREKIEERGKSVPFYTFSA